MINKDFERNTEQDERTADEYRDRRWLETLRISQDPFDKVVLRMVTRGIRLEDKHERG